VPPVLHTVQIADRPGAVAGALLQFLQSHDMATCQLRQAIPLPEQVPDVPSAAPTPLPVPPPLPPVTEAQLLQHTGIVRTTSLAAADAEKLPPL